MTKWPNFVMGMYCTGLRECRLLDFKPLACPGSQNGSVGFLQHNRQCRRLRMTVVVVMQATTFPSFTIVIRLSSPLLYFTDYLRGCRRAARYRMDCQATRSLSALSNCIAGLVVNLSSQSSITAERVVGIVR
jgi:hypothetical protein